MKQNIKSIIITTGGIIGVASSVFLLTFIVFAWTGPLNAPPICPAGEVGCDEPLHSGSLAQSKTGGLLLNTGGATNGLIVQSGRVGIGVETPGAALEVAGKIKSTTDGFEFPDETVQVSAATGTPAGAVMSFAMNTCPSGWIKANGSAISRTNYSDLFTAVGTLYGVGDGSTTFNLPDYRGEFLRGWDDGREVDGGRVFGGGQLDQMQRITGNFNPGSGNSSGGYASYLYSPNSSGSFTHTTKYSTYMFQLVYLSSSNYLDKIYFDSANSPDARASETTDGETRPRNVSVLYCIKY